MGGRLVALTYERPDRLASNRSGSGLRPRERAASIEAPASLAQSDYVAGVVAVVGCDGTGKTRLTADLAANLGATCPTERRYMGLVSGETGNKIRRLPIVGVGLERYLAAKARRAQDMKKKLPGATSAVVMYLLSVWRVAQLRVLIRKSKRGTLIIADRYPQAEVPGFHYDGPGLAVTRSDNWLIRKLAAREQRLYEWMAKQRPALVIRLTIDADTAFARKSDHPLPELCDKIEIIRRIQYNGAHVREIDARMPYAQVLETALQAIRSTVAAERGR